MDSKDKGQSYADQAQKKLKSWSLFSSQSSKFEEAAELLEKAANHFKLAKACECVGKERKLVDWLDVCGLGEPGWVVL